MSKILLIFIIIFLLFSLLSATQLITSDGLQLGISTTLDTIQIDGQSLTMIPNVPSGLMFQEGHPITSINTTYIHPFEIATPVWASAQNSNWTTTQVYYSWLSSGGVSNSRCLKLGNGIATGCGIALNDLIQVSSGTYQFSWEGKSMDTASKYIFCIRLFDENTADITDNITAPSGWIYSGTSKAHTVYGMSNQSIDTWEPFVYNYVMSEKVKWITLSLRYWTGGDYYVYVDNIEILKTAGIDWQALQSVTASLETTTNPNQYQFQTEPAGKNLRFQLTYTVSSQYIRVNGGIQDLNSPQIDRTIRLFYSLPVKASGWNWDDDINNSRNIDTSNSMYENVFNLTGRNMAKYPFCSIQNMSTGVALAVPMDIPRLQNSYYETNAGLKINFDVGLSPQTISLGTGTASFSFLIYKLDEPKWGFRSTAKKYYEIFPEYFVKRNQQEGAWEYPIAPTSVSNPSDFGFKFFETSPQSSTIVAYCQQNGIEIYHYHEPWGTWQLWGYATVKPSYNERVLNLQSWALDTLNASAWLRAPRWYTAQAVLNSGYLDNSSLYYIDSNSYYWHQWSGSSAWNQLWPMNPEMNLPQPNTWTLYKDYFVDYKSQDKSGMYVDSIIGDSLFGNTEDYSFTHFSTATQPLTFSYSNGKPVIASQLAQYGYLDWLSTYLHGQDKKVMGNIFVSGYRFYAPLLDILGSEIFNVTEPDSDALLRRTLSYQKTNSNLLQFWDTRYLTRDEIETYIKNQMFYGFFPGISSGGGGLTYGAPERYFLHSEQYERDRDLFVKYIPVIRIISSAGWETIPYLTSSSDSIRFERFGNWTSGNVYYSIKNNSSDSVTATFTLDYQALNIPELMVPKLGINIIPGNTAVSYSKDSFSHTVSFQLGFNGNDIKIIRFQYQLTDIHKKFWKSLH